MTDEEIEEIITMMEAVPDMECGPAPERCINAPGGNTCPVHLERERVMSEAFWKVYDAVEANKGR